MKRFALLLFLVACDQQELRDLDASLAALDAERARLNVIARDAAAWREKQAKVDAALAQARDETPAKLVERVRAAGFVVDTRPGGGWTIGRDDANARAGLAEIARLAPALPATQIVVEPKRWWIEVPDAAISAEPAATSDPRVTPTPAKGPNTAAGRRRIQIERLQKEIDDLDKLVGDLRFVASREASLRTYEKARDRRACEFAAAIADLRDGDTQVAGRCP